MNLGWKPKHWWNQRTDKWAHKIEQRVAPREHPERRLIRLEGRLARHLGLDGPDAFATANYRSLIADVLERLGRVDEACTMQARCMLTLAVATSVRMTVEH